VALKGDWEISWLDRGRDPTCAPDPNYPNGKDVDVVVCPDKPICEGELQPYPAPRCGLIMIKCNRCGSVTGVTTAGRPDDPRSLRMNCTFRREIDWP
jgi:hypothetical protein